MIGVRRTVVDAGVQRQRPAVSSAVVWRLAFFVRGLCAACAQSLRKAKHAVVWVSDAADTARGEIFFVAGERAHDE